MTKLLVIRDREKWPPNSTDSVVTTINIIFIEVPTFYHPSFQLRHFPAVDFPQPAYLLIRSTAIIYSLFGHVARMPDEADTSTILAASHPDDWRRPPGRPHVTWFQDYKARREINKNSPWTKRSIWLRTDHSARDSCHLHTCSSEY